MTSLPGYDAWKLATPPEYENGVAEAEAERDELLDHLDECAQRGEVDPVAWLRVRADDFGEGRDNRLILRLADELADAIERTKLPDPAPDHDYDDIAF